MLPPPPRPTLLPYTTLFRSCLKSSTVDAARIASTLSAASFERSRAFFRSSSVCANSAAFLAPSATDVHASIDLVAPRSEEHTSELQSRFDLVCRLLLEKKER